LTAFQANAPINIVTNIAKQINIPQLLKSLKWQKMSAFVYMLYNHVLHVFVLIATQFKIKASFPSI